MLTLTSSVAKLGRPPVHAVTSAMATDAAAFRTVQPLEYYLKFLEQGVRPDGRALLRPRKATATGGVVSSADGSCTIKLGQTVVIAGVHCEPAVPTQAEPTLGRVIVSLEVSAVASVAASSGQRGSAERQNRELLGQLQQRRARRMKIAQCFCREASSHIMPRRKPSRPPAVTAKSRAAIYCAGRRGRRMEE